MKAHRRFAAIGLAAAAVGAWLAIASAAAAATTLPAAGPPYPEAVTGQRVYDYAGIFSPAAVSGAEQTILAIEQRTGAQVGIYTQVKPESDTLDKANADALALMNQWGVGRKGFDDGLVILFDMEGNLQHGQVSLYAGSGFKAAFLTDSDRQAIFDSDMKPRLKAGDFDGALTTALDDVNSAATPEHADQLNRARILNAIAGIGVFVLSIWLVAFLLIRWYTHGRDPIYVDDNSVLMPAPPDGLTPAMATLLMDDRTSSRTVSAAMVDLAARGLIQFRQEEAFPKRKKTSVGLTGKTATIGTPEGGLYAAIGTSAGPDGIVDSGSMPQLAPSVGRLKSDLETFAVTKGWLAGRPSRVVGIWIAVAVAEGLASIPLIVWTLNLGASGGLMGGAALIVAAVITGVTAWFMPSRTQLGAMLRAMLAAYRRTLQYTMTQAQSMNQVVESRALPWVSTPDEAMAWGVAFGLNAEIDAVLRRSVDAASATGRPAGWYPMWWIPAGGTAGGGSFGGGGGGAFSASAIPDVGSMMSAIGSIGASTSHSGGGGFGGGGGEGAAAPAAASDQNPPADPKPLQPAPRVG